MEGIGELQLTVYMNFGTPSKPQQSLSPETVHEPSHNLKQRLKLLEMELLIGITFPMTSMSPMVKSMMDKILSPLDEFNTDLEPFSWL